MALLAAVRVPLLGAALLALAVAFKPYALAWLPGLIGFAGIGPLLVFLGASAVLWLPALVAWGSGSVLWSLREAEALHPHPYYSLAYALGSDGSDVPKVAWGLLRIMAGLALAILTPRADSLSRVAHHRWVAGVRGHALPGLVGHVRLPRSRRAHPLLAHRRLAGPGRTRRLAG